MESDLVPYQALTHLPARRVLVLAPHPDDETFGCGGAIAAHVAQGTPVHLLVLTDGAAYGDAVQRQDECRAAARELGCEPPEFWDLPDRRLAECDAAARVTARVRELGADLVYAPSPWEVHPDHRAGAALAIQAARGCGVRLAFYELGAPLRPNVLLDITPHLARKQAAGACYASQLAQQDYAGQLMALNRYRTYTLPREVQAAEALLLLQPGELETRLPALLAAHPVAAAPATATGNLPLVSILVRSVDRATLQTALDSVAVQTYPRIEVVVVAAQPGHRELAPRCGPHALRLVQAEAPLARSQTANRALDSAQGELLLFLDDDDWLLPGHVERLVAALRGQPQTLAAYTGVLLANERGEPRGQVLDLAFDSVRQLAGNLTPIHAVLFRRELLARGCRFDEALDRYEDWDFWLQVSRHTAMAHVPGVSAAYRIHESSGVHVDSGPQGAATQRIYEKWQAHWRAGQAAGVMLRAWATEDYERRLAEQDELLAQLRETLHQQALTIEQHRHHAEQRQALIAAREHEIAELRASSSWRVTAPLRWLSARLRGTP